MSFCENNNCKANFCEFDFKIFFEKIKILNELEKASSKTTQLEKDAAFIKALKPLLSAKLQIKADEAIKMLPFFSIVQTLKNSGVV